MYNGVCECAIKRQSGEECRFKTNQCLRVVWHRALTSRYELTTSNPPVRSAAPVRSKRCDTSGIWSPGSATRPRDSTGPAWRPVQHHRLFSFQPQYRPPTLRLHPVPPRPRGCVRDGETVRGGRWTQGRTLSWRLTDVLARIQLIYDQ